MPGDFEFTRDHTLYQPKSRRSFPIPDDEWDRLKSLISRISPESRLFRTLGSVALAIAGSAVLSLLALSTAENVPSKIWIAAWVFCIAPLLIGIGLLVLDNQQVERTRTSAEWVVDEMERLEGQYEPPPSEQRRQEREDLYAKLMELDLPKAKGTGIDGPSNVGSGEPMPPEDKKE